MRVGILPGGVPVGMPGRPGMLMAAAAFVSAAVTLSLPMPLSLTVTVAVAVAVAMIARSPAVTCCRCWPMTTTMLLTMGMIMPAAAPGRRGLGMPSAPGQLELRFETQAANGGQHLGQPVLVVLDRQDALHQIELQCTHTGHAAQLPADHPLFGGTVHLFDVDTGFHGYVSGRCVHTRE